MILFLMLLVWLVLSLPPFVSAIRKMSAADSDDETAKAGWAIVRASMWAVFVLVGLWFTTWLFDLRVDSLWFADLGYSNRFWQQFNTELALFWGGFILIGCFWLVNVQVMLRLAKKIYDEIPSWVSSIARATAVVPALLFGFAAKTYWLDVLSFLNRQPFGKTDPVFGKDISFYVFTAPLVRSSVHLTELAVLMAIVVAIIVYLKIVNGDYPREKEQQARFNFVVSHLSALGIIWFAANLIGTFMARYEILYSTHGNVYGAGFTDIFWQLPGYWAYMVALVICIGFLGIAIISKSYQHTLRNAGIGLGGAVVVWLLGVAIAPEVVQWTYVRPNELQLEQPYIQREIDFTRAGYGLDKVAQIDFPVKDGLTPANLSQDSETLESARIWDWNVLLSTNHQTQAFKSYYSFRDVDVDRYEIGGKKVQIMYSGRELDVDKLPDSAKTWQNMHLVYTHGYAGVGNPVNAFTSEGLPDYWVKDIPVTSRYPELAVKQPRIYFGEASSNHVYVNTKMPEYDYPVGDSNATSHYDGKAGIPLGGFWQRLAIAWNFDGLWKTWSDELTPDSRIIFDRDVATRTEKLVPFLRPESDIYQVVADGQLWYMMDFETTTAYYPYSFATDGINYIRNSVKAVVNAYTGETNFYVFDPNDPIIQTYEKVFPGLFRPAAEMPASLRKHVRYPQELLQIQGAIYASYHMQNSTSFYNREDVWDFAKQFSPDIDKPQVVSPYYLVMALPGNRTTEYMEILPFTPKSTDDTHQRNNLESWLAARCDGDHFGELVLYKFPTTKQVQGPLQVGVKMNQDSELSKTFTLWNQQGSKVVLGDMRVIPLSDNRILDVQAIYLQSSGAQMPQLKLVVASSGEKIVYEPTFEQALGSLVGSSDTILPPPPGQGNGKAVASRIDPTQDFLNGFDSYLRLLQEGKFSDSGRELDALREARARMKNAGK